MPEWYNCRVTHHPCPLHALALLLTLPNLVGCFGHSPLLNDEVELIESYGGSISVGWSPERVYFFDHVQPIPIDDSDFEVLIEALREFRTLKSLNMKATDISDRSLPLIATLKTLERVELAGTKVTRDGILHLGKLPELELLILSRDKFTDADLQFLQLQMPCVEFWLAEEPYPNHSRPDTQPAASDHGTK